MRRLVALTLLAMAALAAMAATKDSGTTTLKDVQPAGVTDKKNKHQQYDISFVSMMGKIYTCRTPEKEKVKATDLVVGSNATYQVSGDKGKLKIASGKQLNCTVVRVANASAESK